MEDAVESYGHARHVSGGLAIFEEEASILVVRRLLFSWIAYKILLSFPFCSQRLLETVRAGL